MVTFFMTKSIIHHFIKNVCIAITGGISGTLKEKIYQELGLESFENGRWFRKLCFFYKILKTKSPIYLFRIIPKRRSSYITRNPLKHFYKLLQKFDFLKYYY